MRRITVAGLKRRGGRLSASLARRWGALPNEIDDTHASSFKRWNEDRSGKLKQDYPSSWTAIDRPSAPHPAVAVVIHVHYPDLLAEILERLIRIPVSFDLIVTNSSGHPLAIDGARLGAVRDICVLDVPNHGRDILPLVHLVNSGMLDPYELLLKVHTKKSAWRGDHPGLSGDGDTWRKSLLDSLLPARESVIRILDDFASNSTLGLLTSPGSIVGPEFWGGDRVIVRDLLRRIQHSFDERELEFASGSMYWCRAFLIQALRGFDLRADDFEVEAGQVDGTTAHGIERVIGIMTAEAGYATRDSISTIDDGAHLEDAWRRYGDRRPTEPRARAIPFYLPQFHTFPENDSWWGRGFTEWSNVTAAKPLYEGHAQPFLPGELGFYDLLHEGVREEQYELARAHGISGLMYYFYWFAGKQLMSGPLESLIAGASDNPFCIMWANENWSRRWDGSDTDVLIKQDYDHVPANQFIHDVMHILTDHRYLTVDGRPIIVVYKITQIPDFITVMEYWRAAALDAGLPGLEILTVDVGAGMDGIEGDPQEQGLDAYLEFPPHNMPWDLQWQEPLRVNRRFEGKLHNYGSGVAKAEEVLRREVDANRYPGVMVNFDNTARRQWKPDLWYGSNPYTFRRWLNAAVGAVMDREPDRRMVFINAWNEWAESAVLEPSQRWGRSYLLAARDVLIR